MDRGINLFNLSIGYRFLLHLCVFKLPKTHTCARGRRACEMLPVPILG